MERESECGFHTDPANGRQAYLVHATQRCLLETLVQVAGTRGCIESSFEATKQEAGLDEHEVRSTAGWYRHITLALLRATTLPNAAPRWCPYKKARRQPGNLQTVPRAEPGGRRLLWLRIMPRTRHVLAWPWLDWKRHHGWAAQCCHYRRRIQPTGLQLYYTNSAYCYV